MKYYGLKKNFLMIEDKYSSYDKSKIAILPVPYEATTSYGKGTGKGPEGILNASHFVEFFDEEMKRELCFEKGICSVLALDMKGKKENPRLTSSISM
jgi:agmatinase